MGLMALAGAPTWALPATAFIAAEFGFSYLIWNDLESMGS
jgi:hypothetical protein